MFKKEKLYKFVYKRPGGFLSKSEEVTLLVAAKDNIRAVKKFYELATYNVDTILEFTEVEYLKGINNHGK